MNDIKWKDGAVCFAGGEQYADVFVPAAVMAKDFQLNEIRKGDYIEAYELDTEQKYNDAVDVIELFGFSKSELSYGRHINQYNADSFVLSKSVFTSVIGSTAKKEHCKRKLTYTQLMTIGKLKRAMIDFEKFNRSDIPQNEKRNKSKQAYEILKSLDYEYDLVKQKWFRKEYV